MAKAKSKSKSSLIGAVGGTLVGSAILFFIITIILNQLKTAAQPTGTVTGNSTEAINNRADWNATNASIDTLLTFTTICTILLGVLGVTMVGASIIGYITGAFA